MKLNNDEDKDGEQEMAVVPSSGYEIPFRDAQGQERTLGEFSGQVLLIVNTASY